MQLEWSSYVDDVRAAIRGVASAIHGEWYSAADSQYQNACFCVEFPECPDAERVRTALSHSWLLAACRHLDPEEGVMRAGHTVTDADLAALRKVLGFVSAHPRAEPGPAALATQLEVPDAVLTIDAPLNREMLAWLRKHVRVKALYNTTEETPNGR